MLVNDKLDILQFRGRTGAYLEPAAGTPQHNLFKMAREGLLSPLRMAFLQAKKTKTVVRKKGVRDRRKRRHARSATLPWRRSPAFPTSKRRSSSCSFEKSVAAKLRAPAEGRRAKASRAPGAPSPSWSTSSASTKEYLESLVEEHARTNDDLAATNEEFVSSNEELQSMNEELETAKEELQSTNEELTTVNDELHSRNQEVSQSNADLVNLLNTVDIPVVMLDAERRIKRFTPHGARRAQRPTVGRRPPDRRDQAQRRRRRSRAAGRHPWSLRAARRESEVQDRQGHWYRMQVRPSQNSESKIDGAILSLIDIDALKHNVADAEWARDYALDIVEAVQVPLVVLDESLRVLSANQAFYGTFQTTEESTKAHALFDLDQHQWNIPALRIPLEQMLCDQDAGSRISRSNTRSHESEGASSASRRASSIRAATCR